MKIYTQGTCKDKVLYLDISSESELGILNDFAGINEPLTAIVKKNHGYIFPTIEIRKEQK